jgi:hypothetical protein
MKGTMIGKNGMGEGGKSMNTSGKETPRNQENDFIDAVKGALGAAGVFLLIFIILTAIDVMR